MIAQLKKGVLEFCILLTVSKGEFYGYEIMKEMTAAFDGTSEQTVYAVLRRLLEGGHVECYAGKVSGGPPRKYYRLTDSGSAYLRECRKDWEYVSSVVEGMLSK